MADVKHAGLLDDLALYTEQCVAQTVNYSVTYSA